MLIKWIKWIFTKKSKNPMLRLQQKNLIFNGLPNNEFFKNGGR